MFKKALILGITGQDGSYLAEFLLNKGYEVYGIIRKSSSFNTSRIDHLLPNPRLILNYGDLSGGGRLLSIVPDEIYNLAALSHVRVSFDLPEHTGEVTGLGVTKLLEEIKYSGKNDIKFYQASSSEMFGNAPMPQNEKTPFEPRSPYAAAKAYAFWMTKNYREAYNFFSCNGILYNHESPRRGETFVTKKICKAIAKILAKKQDKLYLGNLEAKRDWGYAPEYIEAMWKILQQDRPDDFVIGTGETYSVKYFLEVSFSYVGLKWEDYVVLDNRYFRPTEINKLIADNTKATTQLDWVPKINFHDLIKIMLDSEMRKVGLTPIGEGDKILNEKFPKKWWKYD